MSELVSAINCLCRLLNSTINISVKPEYFRLSKMNKFSIDEMEQFWNILHKLCCFSTSGSCKNKAVKCVTSYLWTEGPVIAYILSPEATPRQLLLCFGWFLSQGVIEAIIEKIIFDTPLGHELPVELEESIGGEANLSLADNCSEKGINYAMFLSGVIQHNLKAISNYRQERAHLITKLHKATAGTCGLPHLSAGEINLLSQPELLADFLSQCCHCVPVLENYCKWRKKSAVFWQWMDSILREEESWHINKQPFDTELHHLREYTKLLENYVRRNARLEDDDIARERLECLFIGKMQLSEDRKSIDKAINLLDSRIEILDKTRRRKKQELEMKLSRKANSNEIVNEINIVLNNFGLGLNKFTEAQLVTKMDIPTKEALAKLSLDKCKQTVNIT